MFGFTNLRRRDIEVAARKLEEEPDSLRLSQIVAARHPKCYE